MTKQIHNNINTWIAKYDKSVLNSHLTENKTHFKNTQRVKGQTSQNQIQTTQKKSKQN